MNQISDSLRQILHSIDELTIEKLVTASGMRKEADSTKFSYCALKLQAMYLTIVHKDHHPSKDLRDTISKELVSLSKKLRIVRSTLNGTTKPNVLGALDAASVDLNFVRGTRGETPIHFKKIIEELQGGLATLSILVDHFFNQREAFDKIKPSFLTVDVLFKDKRTRVADGSLNAYFRKPSGVSAATIIVRSIGDIYKRLFHTNFGVTTKSREGRARYGGPGIRFACIVVNELRLIKHFNAASEVELINKIGDTWTNDKRRRKAK